MKFEVRVYSEDGRSKGATILDSTVDVLDGHPVNSLGMARNYAARYLARRSDYCFVEQARPWPSRRSTEP